MNYEKLSKNALKCMYVGGALWNIIGMIVLLGIWRGFFADNRIVGIFVIVLCVLLLVTATVFPPIRYRRYRYAINEECIDIVEGIFWIKRNIVPIERLHKIAVERDPVDQLYNTGKVIVTTAGGDVTIRYLEIEKAEQIADSLKKRINEVATESRGEEHEG